MLVIDIIIISDNYFRYYEYFIGILVFEIHNFVFSETFEIGYSIRLISLRKNSKNGERYFIANVFNLKYYL
jgi:hypothetical protein